MDDDLKEFISELREYGNNRRGELAGMILEAANRLEEQGAALELLRRLDKETDPATIEGLYNRGLISRKLRNVITRKFGSSYMGDFPAKKILLSDMQNYHEQRIKGWRGMGDALVEELRDVMHKHGFYFANEAADADDQ